MQIRIMMKCSSHPYALLRAFIAFEQEGDLYNLKQTLLQMTENLNQSNEEMG